MGFIDAKGQLIGKINELEAIGDLPKIKKSYSIPSVNSKSFNLTPFLLDLLAASCKDVPGGTNITQFTTQSIEYKPGKNIKPKLSKCDVMRVLTDILSDSLPIMIQNVKEGIITSFKASFSCGSDFTIPTTTQTVLVKISDIDPLDILKVDPNSRVGSFYYGNNEQYDLDLKVNNSLQNGNAFTWKNIIDTQFTSHASNPTVYTGMSLTVNSNYSGQPFDKFLRDYMNTLPLFGKKSVIPGASGSFNLDTQKVVMDVISKITDSLFGTLSTNETKSLDKIVDIEKTNQMIQKIIDSNPCDDNFYLDDSFFTFTKEELELINRKSLNRHNGLSQIDVGCGIVETSVNILELERIRDNIVNVDNEPQLVKDVITQTLIDLYGQSTTNFSLNDQKLAQNGLSTNILNELVKILVSVIFTPSVMMIYQVISGMVKQTTYSGDGSTYKFTFDNRTFFENVTRETSIILTKILYNIVRREILNMISSIFAKIIKEQAKLRVKAILSVLFSIAEGLINQIPSPIPSEFT